MSDATITNALWKLRLQIVRGDMDGLEHVNALLLARDCDPDTQRVPPKRPANRFRKSELRRYILTALRSGPRGSREIAAYVAVQRPDLSAEQAFSRVSPVLSRMKDMGLVRREGRLWCRIRLAPAPALNASANNLSADAGGHHVKV